MVREEGLQPEYTKDLEGKFGKPLGHFLDKHESSFRRAKEQL